MKKKSDLHFPIFKLQIVEKVFLHRLSAIDPGSPVRSRLKVNFFIFLYEIIMGKFL